MNLFDKEKDEMLIKLVRGKPVIYDSSHPQHRNLIAKHAEWKEISTAMGVPITDIQKRWKHFRDHYKKKKKLKSKKNTWRYMHLLEFLSAPSKLSQSGNRRRVEEQRKALSQEPQTPELSDISTFSFEDLEDPRARFKTPLPETGFEFTSNILPEVISPITRRHEDIQILTGPSTSFHNDKESSLSFEEALRKWSSSIILSDEIPKEDQKSSNSEDIYPKITKSIDEKITGSDVSIDGRHDSSIYKYFALIAEITTMFPPHLVSDLKLKIHKSIYRIELDWQKEKREVDEMDKGERKKRDREEMKKTNRLIAFNYRQLRSNNK